MRSHAMVRLDGAISLGNDRDFILKYRLADAKSNRACCSRAARRRTFSCSRCSRRNGSRRRICRRATISSWSMFPARWPAFRSDVTKALIKQLLGHVAAAGFFQCAAFFRRLDAAVADRCPATPGTWRGPRCRSIASTAGAGRNCSRRLKKALALPNRRARRAQHRGDHRWLCGLEPAGV